MSDSVIHFSKDKQISDLIEEGLMKDIASRAKEASRLLSVSGTTQKNEALIRIADNIVKNTKFLIDENAGDLQEARDKGLNPALVDRLELNARRINSMAEGLRQVAALEDPVGEITRISKRPNGLSVGRMRIPLGVIGIIYESRPNVTGDAAGLCLKSGNSVILRGGSEAIRSNKAIGNIIRDSIASAGLPEDAVQIVPVTDRKAILEMLKLEDLIDLIIPRGGEGLIRFVSENSRIPVLKHYKGVCHVYVDEHADMDMACSIAVNSKVQRPGVCNSMETLLVNKKIARDFLPVVTSELLKHGVELRGCSKSTDIIPDMKPADEMDWYEEYLDLILNIKVVDSMDEAISHIDRYGSMHTESIVTGNYENVSQFLSRVNSSAVMVNASTRFNDGFELGLGAEIGISTSKLHSFGPMGVNELTSTKFIVLGSGQVKE